MENDTPRREFNLNKWLMAPLIWTLGLVSFLVLGSIAGAQGADRLLEFLLQLTSRHEGVSLICMALMFFFFIIGAWRAANR